MLFGLLVSAAESATWPVGTRKLAYIVPAAGTEYLYLGLSPVVTSPSSGGQCLVTCQINTADNWWQDAYMELVTDLGDGTRTGTLYGDTFYAHEVTPWNTPGSGGFLASDDYFAVLHLKGTKGSVTSTNVYKLAGGRRYTFGCQLHPKGSLLEMELRGRISWICR